MRELWDKNKGELDEGSKVVDGCEYLGLTIF